MKSLNAKLVLSIFAVVAMLTRPAFAKKAERATHSNASSIYSSPVYGAIPGYDRDGNVIAIPDVDQSGLSSR